MWPEYSALWQSARRVRKIACEATELGTDVEAILPTPPASHAVTRRCRDIGAEIGCKIFFFTVLLAGPVQPASCQAYPVQERDRPGWHLVEVKVVSE
jgi:hypothetical protein